MNTETREYIVDRRVEASLAAYRDLIASGLNAMRRDGVRFECDMPLSKSALWPKEVQEASKRLAENPRAISESKSYVRSGFLELPEFAYLWDDFVNVAPYSYDAGVYDPGVDGAVLASLADEGASVIFMLSSVQADLLMRGGVATLRPVATE